MRCTDLSADERDADGGECGRLVDEDVVVVFNGLEGHTADGLSRAGIEDHCAQGTSTSKGYFTDIEDRLTGPLGCSGFPSERICIYTI